MPESRSGLALRQPIRVVELAERFGGEVDPEARDRWVERIAPVAAAGRGDLAPLFAAREIRHATRQEALYLVDAALAERCPAGLRWQHDHAAYTLAVLLEELVASPRAELPPAAAFHASPGAEVHPSASLAPGVVVLAGARIGPECALEPNAVVYGGVELGRRVVVGASAVIGRPGFGWVRAPDGSHRRMPQLGGVVIEDDVEIGPLSTVDAGTLAPTCIRRGTKLDAQTHIGHNVEIGERCLVAAQSGFAGSVRVGRGVQVGGQAGVADHVSVGAGARLAAKSGVIGDVSAGSVVAGYPAVDRVRWLRATAELFRLCARRK